VALIGLFGAIVIPLAAASEYDAEALLAAEKWPALVDEEKYDGSWQSAAVL
jgi:hypothetical protein